jgi:hypothetical protein
MIEDTIAMIATSAEIVIVTVVVIAVVIVIVVDVNAKSFSPKMMYCYQ